MSELGQLHPTGPPLSKSAHPQKSSVTENTACFGFAPKPGLQGRKVRLLLGLAGNIHKVRTAYGFSSNLKEIFNFVR